mmetsp:Transcript_23148/g.56534  ORF Transcript_23148/g.56534 Transcript_23148/m.56534 type:complete len:186 (+) Transcript_23148:217-774(+)
MLQRATAASVFALVVLAVFESFPVSGATPIESICHTSCEFHFCGTDRFRVQRYNIGAAQKAFTGPICRGSEVVSHVSKLGEALVSSDDGASYVSIGEFAPPDLETRFSSTFFRVYPIDEGRRVGSVATTGVGHEEPQGNQDNYLDGLCVKVPITRYERDRGSGLVEEVQASDLESACVSLELSAA